MAINCDSKDVSLAGTGKLKLRSFWSSDRPGGELVRFEVRLPDESRFRFLVEGARTTVVKATRQKVKTGTAIEISADYINTIGDPVKRLAQLVFCGITKDGSGVEIEVASLARKFLP